MLEPFDIEWVAPVLHEFLVFGYVAAIGFVTAGLSASAFQFSTGEPLKFELVPASQGMRATAEILACVIAGPVILMRNAIRGALIEHRPVYWLAASTLISAFWSFFSGALVVELALAL